MYVIGHPVGLPTKFADGANVRNNNNTSFFVCNLDTYGGNSGSPVFNSSTHELEGILVRGETDFIVTENGCRKSNVCPQNDPNLVCRGEDLQDQQNFKIWFQPINPFFNCLYLSIILYCNNKISNFI